MNTHHTMNQRLMSAGITTLRTDSGVFLCRNGKCIERPHVENCEAACLTAFNVVI